MIGDAESVSASLPNFRPLQADPTGPVERGLELVGLEDPALLNSVAGALRFVLAFVVVWALGRFVVLPLVRRAFDRRGLDEHARNPLLILTRFGILFVAIAVAFGAGGFGNFLVSMAGIAAAGALAIGLAMQNVISNFVAGIFIYTDKPFRIGDWIEWDNGDYAGVVEDISLRVTRVRTFDNELLTVPNSVLTDDVIKNPVEGDKLRLKFVFGIGYDDDIEQATTIIVDEAERHDGIADEPGPSVRLTELNDSDVGLQSRFWIENPSRSDFVRIKGEYITAVKRRFDEEGIDIPYPVRTLDGDLSLNGAGQRVVQPAE
ncbi:mechanosensitive ion channel family protein [Halopiger xanaduensis]|uniref:MscS Mechanosensitive ion channel n=1 Tax=Halopiger xanaduensis (strain DSM 18323 / JCM 14033 / SH-6) TaxID=797210 RepID=F8D4A1_HALXS|nr:mechanosensitive ion channel family protein [Halopiger xanaduensis]AEH37508.1 MscS Mechanosensitive ion channel [Halopiger xanaduensis SH-6]